jgi:hypothetical protein
VNHLEAAPYDEFAYLEQRARHEGIAWTGRPPVESSASATESTKSTKRPALL